MKKVIISKKVVPLHCPECGHPLHLIVAVGTKTGESKCPFCETPFEWEEQEAISAEKEVEQMTLDAAIERNQTTKNELLRDGFPARATAIQLGIEALKRIKDSRHGMTKIFQSFLPGETE